MERTTFPVGTFEVNCSIVFEGGKALVVDPGAEATLVAAKLATLGLEPAAVLLTHAHFDHVGAVPDLQRSFPSLPVFVSEADAKIVSHPFNQFPPDYPPIGELGNTRDANTLSDFISSLGWRAEVEVIDTPGHTPGGVCYLFRDGGASTLFSGDTLFCCSVGRTDFPGGSMATLRESLGKLKALDPETVVVPGHGSETTIGRELKSNPFLQ